MSSSELRSSGPREAEAVLVGLLDRAADEARTDPRLLARPLRIVVPSRSLREHLARCLVGRSRGAAAGVSVQTLHGLAHEVVSRSRAWVVRGEQLFPVVVRRAAVAEPLLRRLLGHFDDAYAPIEAVVDDLLDAGFQAAHVDALTELLSDASRVERAEVALALVRTAERVVKTLEREGLHHRSMLLREAADALLERGQEALPCRRLIVYGFADATGLATDLIGALVRGFDAHVILDEPPAPGSSEADPLGRAFVGRLRDRLGLAQGAAPERNSGEPARLELLSAAGAEAEAGAVADRIVGALAAGVAPEAIGVVVRDASPYAVALRNAFSRSGIPFSGSGIEGPRGATARRAHALLQVLECEGRASLDDLLGALGDGALGGFPPGRGSADLRLALRTLGIRSLAELAALAVPGQALALPVRVGLHAGDDRPPHAPHARFAAERLREVQRRARTLLAILTDWPDAAPVRAHLGTLRRVLATLGWAHGAADRDRSCETPLVDALERLAADAPRELALGRAEFALLLARQLGDLHGEPIGGAGGGVCVLTVMEARGRTFDRLFVLGLNRDVFPRPVREDPLLPDALRRPLCTLLPELPLKLRGYDEERYLFAQLVASSPVVTLSWQHASDDGRARATSTLVERLRWARPDLEVVRVGGGFDANHFESGLRPARTVAREAALRGSRADRERAFVVAFEERARALGEECAAQREQAAEVVAAARLAVVDEFDRPPHLDQLGPYFGFVGPVVHAADPRGPDPFVTTLESVATCGWRTLLERWLRLEPPPDPEAALPEADAARVGRVVHEVLERVVRDALSEATDAAPVTVAWPEDERVEGWLRAAASRVLAEDGVVSQAVSRVLVETARPFVLRAADLDWPNGTCEGVVGAEEFGSLDLGESPSTGEVRRVQFLADRVDRDRDGGLHFTDYKTGSPISAAKLPATRRRHLLQRIESGRNLQAAAYASSPSAVAGRYLQLAAEDDAVARDAEVQRDDEEMASAFGRAMEALFAAVERGALAPRLVEPTSGSPCVHCTVRSACLHGDSTARLRLERWQTGAGRSDSPVEAALRNVELLRAGERGSPGAESSS